ncbi:hypothetical protein D3C79_413460 [compost metagenome]
MHHFHVVPGTGWAGVDVAVFGTLVLAAAAMGTRDVTHARGQRLEQRLQALEHVLFATDHHAVATVQAPHTARGADIQVMQPALGQLGGAAHVVLVEGVAAIDDRIARLQQFGQLGDGLLGGLASGQHDPHRARCFQLLYQRTEVVRTLGALALQAGDGLTVAIVYHGAVAGAHQAPCDIAAHAAQPDDSQLHEPMLPFRNK